MNERNDGRRLRRVGAMWKPKPGTKSLGSGSITVDGLRQKFMLFKNDRKRGDREPDYLLMSSDEPEVDAYAQRSDAPARSRQQQESSGPF